MEILDKQAIAKLTSDELRTILVQRYHIAPDKIVATKEQLVRAVLELRRAA